MASSLPNPVYMATKIHGWQENDAEPEETFLAMDFSVTKLTEGLVAPAAPTPPGTLPLSFMDKTPGSVGLVDSIHVFRHGRQPAKIIREALSEALVFYYPVAGRFATSDQDELEVACTADGVYFIDASASCSLEDVNYLQLPLSVPKESILPYPSPDAGQTEGIVRNPLLCIVRGRDQVTEFTCGGFTVGIRSSHAIFDGIGAGQFFQAIADIARGGTEPLVKPIWCRDAIPGPPKLQRGPPPPLPTFKFEDTTLDISSDRINRIKDEFIKKTGTFCSTFDVLTAKVWQSRTRAIQLEEHSTVRIGFAANARHLLYKSLLKEEGYYGNCTYPMTITAPRRKVANGSLLEVISLIKNEKQSLPIRFSKWTMGDPQEDPFKEPIDHRFLSISDWSRVGFSEVDYGWGTPIHFCPVNDYNFFASCIFLRPPAPKQGLRLMARCVAKQELASFQDQLLEFASE
ncbi:hypothetical protein BHM03_00053851 [Ensete ventricosum]|nr:hypothetical protein BHM03_00053851 [Ensete ventricosum]